MFNDISCGSKDNERKNVWKKPNSYLFTWGDFGKGQWSFIGPDSEKKWYCISEDSPQGVWDNIAQRMLVEFAESGCPIFRATSPLSRGQLKSKGHGKLSFHFAANQETIKSIFRIIVSPNQLSLYGRVRILSWMNGATCWDGTIDFLNRAQCDQDRISFG